MQDDAFRFIHASDFHLEEPLCVGDDVPDALSDLLLDAPYHAAEQVFETTLAERADFLVLAGDIVDFRTAGPRAATFLIEQFRRLQQRGIAVYWAGGRVDRVSRGDWQDFLPENVHLFDCDGVECIVHDRNNQPLVEIVGRSRRGKNKAKIRELKPEHTLFSVGVAHGRWPASEVAKQQVDYLALGGEHAHMLLTEEARSAAYSGTPQGRSFEETGPHGCTIVDVSAAQSTSIRRVSTDAVRCVTVAVDGAAARDSRAVSGALEAHLDDLTESADGVDQLVTCRIDGTSARAPSGGARVAAEMLEALRKKFGSRSPAVWPVAVSWNSGPHLPASWFDEQSIRGEFLRAVREVERQSENGPDVQTLVPQWCESDGTVSGLALMDDGDRSGALRRVASMGAGLLSGQDLIDDDA